MKKYLFLFFFPFLALAENCNKTYSYYKGYLVYLNHLKHSEIPLSLDEVIEGMKEAQNGKSEITEKDVLEFYDRYYDQMKEEKLAEANRFLSLVSAKDGVKELVKDKLYYKIEKTGMGLVISDEPLIQYKAMSITGDKEKTIHEILEPKTVSLKATIKGFSLGVQGMHVGEKRVLYIHPDLAYGAASIKAAPNSLIIFEVEAF